MYFGCGNRGAGGAGWPLLQAVESFSDTDSKSENVIPFNGWGKVPE